MNVKTTKDLKTALRNGQWAWPGGYPLYFTTSDGSALSFDAVRENFRLCLSETKYGNCGGWKIVGCDINYEDSDLYCDHTGQRIQSAYGENESESESMAA